MCTYETARYEHSLTGAPDLQDSMVQVVYCRLPRKSGWYSMYDNTSPAWLQPMKDFWQWQDQCRFWLGRKLLAWLLTSISGMYDLNNIRFTQYGRPYISNCPDFNISHSGDFVIAAMTTKGKIGIDIEKIGDICINDFLPILSEDQLKAITEDKDPIRTFYRIWTMKESVVKLLGSGIGLPLENISSDFNTAQFNGDTFYLKELDINSRHSSCLVTDHIISSFSIKEINIEEVAASPEMLR